MNRLDLTITEETHTGSGSRACGKSCGGNTGGRCFRQGGCSAQVIDADTLQAAAIQQGAAAAIADTPFADAEPFDAESFVNDIVGS